MEFEEWYKQEFKVEYYKDTEAVASWMKEAWKAAQSQLKPSWDDAPEWANYLAVDSCGDWFWYEFEPTNDYAGGYWFGTVGRSWMAKELDVVEKSLESRPKKIPPRL